MNNLLLNETTQNSLQAVINNPPNGLMLVGNEGSGKFFIATHLAQHFLKTSPQNSPGYMQISSDAGAIGIDQIRQLQSFLRLKTTGRQNIRRVVVIKDANLLTVEAQNALLKILEEPPLDTIIILTTPGDHSLKPTVYSRVQKIIIRPVNIAMARAFAKNAPAQQVDKAFALSMGDAGLFVSLINQQSDHQLTAAIVKAKNLYEKSTFYKLAELDQIVKDKENLPYLMLALKRIAYAGLKQTTATNNAKASAKWLKYLNSVYECEGLLKTNVNTKILLTDLFLNI